MYAGPRGLKRPARERLGPNVFIRSAAVPVSEPQGSLKRQRQDSVKWNNDLHGGKTPVVKYLVPKDVKYEVSKDLKSPIQKDVIRSSKNIIDSARGFNKKALKIGQTPTNACTAELKVAPSIELVPTKKSAVQSKPAPSLGEKKCIVAEQPTVAAFLQRIGLSKYLINFQAEEVDMFALKHMDDEDLKSMGLPMGPRKKILVALTPVKDSKVRNRTNTVAVASGGDTLVGKSYVTAPCRISLL